MLFLSSLTKRSARAGWSQRGAHSTPQFIATTFERVKLNVRINGKKFENLKDEYDGTLSQ